MISTMWICPPITHVAKLVCPLTVYSWPIDRLQWSIGHEFYFSDPLLDDFSPFTHVETDRQSIVSSIVATIYKVKFFTIYQYSEQFSYQKI